MLLNTTTHLLAQKVNIRTLQYNIHCTIGPAETTLRGTLYYRFPAETTLRRTENVLSQKKCSVTHSAYFKESYILRISPKRVFNKDVVPSIIDFPQHLNVKIASPRRPICRHPLSEK